MRAFDASPRSPRLGRRRWCFALTLLALRGFSTSVAGAEPVRTRLFTIRRSKNENLVCYDWIGPDSEGRGRLDVYWKMNADRGQRQELNGVEREMAYGYRVVQARGRELVIALKAATKRRIVVDFGGRSPVARTTISTELALLESIYVKTQEGALVPKVLFVELLGTLDDGKPVRERIEG